MTLHRQQQPPHDVIILNSASQLGKAIDHIKTNGYNEIHSYFDNDSAGEKAFAKLKEQLKDKALFDYRESYCPHNDLNEYLIAQRDQQRQQHAHAKSRELALSLELKQT